MDLQETLFVSDFIMASPHFEAVFEALVAAVRCFPNRWSEDAQILALICADLVNPDDIVAFLDFAENLVQAARVVRPLQMQR